MSKLNKTGLSIALINWPINDVGGINSWGINLVAGLRSIGVDVDVFYATNQLRFGCTPEKEQVKARYALMEAEHLSYHSTKLKATVVKLNGYDLIIMLHPSPHPTRAVMAKKDFGNWMNLYRDTSPPKCVIFHDANWEKTNSWFDRVADNIDAIIAAQCRFYESVLAYPADCPKQWEYFPLVLGNKQAEVKVDRGIVATQWLKWKNHHKLFPQLERFEYPIDFYGSGQEYYTLKNNGMFSSGIRVDRSNESNKVYYNRKSRNVFYGFRPYKEVLAAMASARVSLDLSTKGYTNMTHWEPLTVKTVSMVENQVANRKDNKIPLDCCHQFDINDIASSFNQIMKDKVKASNIAARGFKFVQICDRVAVATRIIKWLRKEKVIR